MNLVKKFFVFALMLTTVTTLSVTPAFKVEAAGSYGTGSLLALQGASDAAVYYIGSDGKKYVFPDAKTYFTWYENFDNVVRVPVSELDMYPDGGAVTYRAGTKLVKHINTAKVYAVEPGGVVRWITDEATAISLFGANWASRVQDVIPGYFSSSYTVGDDMGNTLPTGSLVMEPGGSTYYYIENGTKRPFASADAFEANGFDYDNVLTMSLSGYTEGDSITGEEAELSGFMPGEGGQTPVGGDLNVSLASDTPAVGVAVTGAARLPFTKVRLQTGALGVTIDSIVVERGGLGQDGAFTSVDILDSNMLPFDNNSKSFNSTHQATFTKDITIPANTTMYIYLAGNMGTIGNTYAGEYPTLGISSITLAGGGSVIGSLPIFGNYMTTNGTLAIGSATVSRGSYTNSTSSTLEVGRTDYSFFSFQVENTGNEDLSLRQLSVYQQGTADPDTDLSDFELFRDGTKLADGMVNGDYINFVLTSPLLIPEDQIYQFQVKADIVDGSARTIDLGVYRATDLLFMGQTYGYNVTPTYSGTGYSTNSPVLSDNEFTISTGTLTVERSTTVGSENISIGNNQVLGAFKFTVKGEPISITDLTLAIASTTGATTQKVGALEAVKLVNATSNTTLAGPTDHLDGSTNIVFSDTFTLPVGDTVVKVVGNLRVNKGWDTDDTIYASIAAPETDITAEGEVTGNNLTAAEITPTAAVSTNTQTVKGAYLAVTRNTLPASGTVIAGQQDVELGSWTFNATNSGEDVRVTTIAFAASSSAATNLTVFDGTTALTPVNDAPDSTVDGATTTFNFDSPIIITKGTSKTIKLVGDINTNATADQSSQFGITDASTYDNPSVQAYGVSTNARAYTAITADNGAIFTYSGTGTVTVSNNNNPNNGFVRAGSTGNIFGYIKIDALNEDLDLDELHVFVADGGVTGTATGNYQDVAMLYIYDGSTLLGSASSPTDQSTGMYDFDFPNGTLTVAKDSYKTLTVKADMATISQTVDNAPGTPGVDIKFGLGGTDGFKFTGNASNSTITSETYNGSTTSAMVLHKAIPTVTFSTTSNRLGAASALTNGAVDLYAFNVAADNGGNEVLLYRATFEVATSGAGAWGLTNCILKDGSGNTVGAATTPTGADATAMNLLTYTFNNPNISAGDAQEALTIATGSSATYTLNCQVSGADSGDVVSVALVGDAASSTPAASHGTPAAAGQNTAAAWSAYDKGNFVWSDNFKNRGLATDGANATAYGQWYNGYLVPGIGTVGTTSAYTVGWSS